MTYLVILYLGIYCSKFYVLNCINILTIYQISTGNCGVIRADESIRTTILFTGTALGVYTAELVCLVLNQVRTTYFVVSEKDLHHHHHHQHLPSGH